MSRLWASILPGLLALTPALAAEPWLDSVAAEARVAAGEPAAVSMSYFLHPGGASAVGFTSIRFGESRVANVRAFLDGREISFRREGPSEARVDGRVELPQRARSADRILLRLTYEVLPAHDLDGERLAVVLPLLVAEWPPVETRPETFLATVNLPGHLFARSAFPSAFERIDSIEKTSSDNVYRFVLPVVPALLRLETATVDAPFLTVERAIDVGTVALLLLLAAVGWRRMRESLA